MNKMHLLDYGILLLFAVVFYCVGGLSPAVIISRKIGGFDVRQVGSGNAGSTNILRSMGWRFAILNLVLDAFKGALPVLAARLLLPAGQVQTLAVIIGALAVVLGHNFSVYMKFKGGKGVAASLGAMVAISPAVAAIALGVAIVVIVVTRYVSLGSLLGTLTAVLLCAFTPLTLPASLGFVAPAFLLMCYTHRENILRLCKGQERRLQPGGRTAKEQK
ncbi:MAG: glycerol-3-phosphate 1-O-acyltransferase PlsY [Eubacteriales bacterium]|nr:glycerol-3-phosphate 1-O-acyltransferase PlsY [Eubacteriales bacterium]